MASLSRSDLGLGPSAPDNERRRARRYVEYADESGARRLPPEAYEPYDADPLDEEVVLPGVGRPQAGMFFGIGVGLGIAVLAVVAGLYLGGYVGRPALGPSPEASSLEPNLLAFEDSQNAEALALARIALAPRALTPTQTESPDIQVLAEPTSTPTRSSEAQPAAPDVQSQRPSGLSNELDELQQSLPPRGPVAPGLPTDEKAAPDSPTLPPPAAPTAPAETSAPDTIPPPNQNP